MIEFALFASILALLIYRATYGYSFNDEPFIITVAQRLYMGDSLIFDEWHLSQSFSPLVLLPYTVYFKALGTTEGKLLAFRIIYCFTWTITLGYIVECLNCFHAQPRTLLMPSIPKGSFEKKLYSMYLSYLPKNNVAYDLQMNCDERGSFTELLKTPDHGQVSVNISKPGVTKGQHWHNSKWEIFIVVSGHGLIQERKIGSDEVIECEVSGNRLQAVYMLPGYTHSIINLSDTEDLITVMWANEMFDRQNPDTFFEKV